MINLDLWNLNPSTLPSKNGWYSGFYINHCIACKEEYLGGKRSFECSKCAYDITLHPEQLNLFEE